MDPKLLLSIIAVIIFAVFFLYEWSKERMKNKKDQQTQKEQSSFYKSIGDQLTENSLINQEILKYLKVSTQKYVEEITESQVRILIESVLQNSQNEILRYTLKIVKENHIKGNEKEISEKIKLFISNRFHKDSLLLKEFKYNGVSIGTIPTSKWQDCLSDGILECILKEKGEKSLVNILENNYDSFRYGMLDAILS